MISGINRDSECFDYLGFVDGAGEPRPVSDEAFDVSAAAAGKKRARIVLIDPQPLTRTSIVQLLSGAASANRRSEDFVIWPVAQAEELFPVPPLKGGEVAAIVFNLGAVCAAEETARAAIDRLTGQFPGVPLVLLSDCQNSAHILSALHDGVRGYIPSVLDSSMLIQAVRLVLAGGTFIPLNVLAARRDPGGAGEAPPEADTGGRGIPREFTPRQTEVFQLLRKGKSNKVIAYELGMQESTVKVHVRQIMRKLKATNRTHAAFLAARRGEEGLG